jgi:membrane protein insertase Oxa1/YidC/SpoIIIJ
VFSPNLISFVALKITSLDSIVSSNFKSEKRGELMSKKENEFKVFVEGGGNEDDLRTLLEKKLELSSNAVIWLMTSSIVIAIFIAQLKIQFNLNDLWGLLLFVAYLLILAVAFPLTVRRSQRSLIEGQKMILKDYLEAKKLLQKTPEPQ